MSIARHHAEWLSLIETSGPFLSLPVLMEVFPQGLDQRDPAKTKELRNAYDEWSDNPDAPGRLRAWVEFVLSRILEFPGDVLVEGQAMPAGLEAPMPEYGETLRPDLVVVSPQGAAGADRAQLLVQIHPSEQDLDKPVAGKHWKASPATRMTELLHAADVPLGVVTNGERWMLVFAPRNETSGYASWYATLWQEEPITQRGFCSLLHVRRFFGVAEDGTILALLKKSAQDQQEVTDQLGLQVRHAVEVLVQALDQIDLDAGRTLLQGLPPTVLYEAALTVMMRLVFLFSAEERGLLRLGEPLYDENYAVSTLREQLREDADQHGEEVLERRFDAWSRLLATFRTVHGGVAHEALRLPAYGGTLFDPDRYPLLEGRSVGSSWRTTPAEPLAVNNRVVLHLLESLQMLQIKVPGGGPAEARRLSFRALDIEQIGHVYEGLLDHTAVLAETAILGLHGTKNKEPEIPLETLETLLGQGEAKLIEFLKEETKRSEAALRRAMQNPPLGDGHRLLIACGHDAQLRDRILPFAGLIREDSFQMPVVILPGSVYVTSGTDRRSTGTHYTPRSLTEPIVQHTLEPLVYAGPAEGWSKDQWKLKTPKDLLALRICDMAMGSGAFLVQTCRYLSERLVEAWENLEQANPGKFIIAPDGALSTGDPSERLLPTDPAERLAIARRAVTDRCIYGVDINPMAVEMAKLSMWLVTLQKDRPFTFLDHAFKCGDSLLGITSLEQLENFSLRPGGGKQQAFDTFNLWRHIEEAKKKREMLEAMPSDTPEQIAAKAALYAEAEDAVAKLNAAADVLVAVELKGLSERAYESEREMSASQMMAFWVKGLPELKEYSKQRLGKRRCLHWALAFPEIIGCGGFSAFVGNPPFLGGHRITGAIGTDYREFLVTHLGHGKRGHADLSAYFLLQATCLLAADGFAGFVTTNTVSEGDTREVGLEQILSLHTELIRATSTEKWPGNASLEVSHIWFAKQKWNGRYLLDGQQVESISPYLKAGNHVQLKPFRLSANQGKSFQGSKPYGQGFVLQPDEAHRLINDDKRNSEVVFPYLIGDDLNSRWDQSPSRWVINFFDWPKERAQSYEECWKIVEERVRPERQRVNSAGAYVVRSPMPQQYWIYGEKRPALYKSISEQKEVLVVTQVSKFHSFVFVPNGMVYDQRLIVLVVNGYSDFSVLQSSIYAYWIHTFGSSLETRPVFTPTDCFDTFPFTPSQEELALIGSKYHQVRKSIMQARETGLTALYNLFHTPSEISSDISELRLIQKKMDEIVVDVYGWQDIDLNHGFHETKQGVRFTISETARREVLDRLLSLNHQRHTEEVATAAAQSAATPVKRGRKKKVHDGQATMDF